MKLQIDPALLLHDSFYRGPLHVGLTWKEETQTVTILSCKQEQYGLSYDVEISVTKRDDDGKTTIVSRKAVRIEIDPYLVHRMRVDNGPYPYVTVNDPKPGYTSVKHSWNSGEVYNEDGVLIQTVKLNGAHKPMFAQTKEILIPKIKRFTIFKESEQVKRAEGHVTVFERDGKEHLHVTEEQYEQLIAQKLIVIVPPAPVLSEEEKTQQRNSAEVAVDEFLSRDSQSLRDYRDGKKSAIGGCMGLIMRSNKGLNPQVVRQVLEQKLSS